MLADYLLDNRSFCRFVHNFLALSLCKINVLDIFNINDFFRHFRRTFPNKSFIRSEFRYFAISQK